MKYYFFERLSMAVTLLVLLAFNFTAKENPYKESVGFFIVHIFGSVFVAISAISLISDAIRYRKWKRKRPWGM